jgi:sidestep protein, putative
VGIREPIELPCEVKADPPQVTFKWALNNSFEITQIKNFVIEGSVSIAKYAPRTKYGYGQMFCWATNKVGQQKEPCIFNIVPAGPPQPIQNCLVNNHSSDSLVIKCEPGEDGGLEQSFHLEVYHSISGLIQANLSSNKSPVFEVHYLSKGTPFLLALYAANAKGRSNTVALAASTLPFSNTGKCDQLFTKFDYSF